MYSGANSTVTALLRSRRSSRRGRDREDTVQFYGLRLIVVNSLTNAHVSALAGCEFLVCPAESRTAKM
jgi:hypothetical protein